MFFAPASRVKRKALWTKYPAFDLNKQLKAGADWWNGDLAFGKVIVITPNHNF